MRIGVDLGGTKIAGVALDRSDATTAEVRVPTPIDDYGDVVRAIGDVVHRLEADVGPAESVGVGLPGSPNPRSGVIRNCNVVVVNGRVLAADLEEALGRPVRVANDANCFALSEAVDGAGAGARAVFGVILGTGVGGGVVFDGSLQVGPNAVAGEWGHTPLPWPRRGERPGPACFCGRHGCLDTLISGPALEAAYALRGGGRKPAAEIAEAAATGDEVAVETVLVIADRVARGLAMIIDVLDPDVIVVGGGLSNVTALYDVVPDLWGRYVFSDEVVTPFVPAVHGDASGVRGAAFL